jgi:SAM-dependent methyltransferase
MSKLWEHYGSKDPYYGVLSIPEFHSDRMSDEAKAKFFASGVVDVDSYIELAQSTYGALNFDTALDYGCGVGRLSRRLADLFTQVIAVDISDSMLENAQQNLQGRNVHFENAARMTSRPVNFMLSQMVFQHIRPENGLKIIPTLLDRLRGTAIIEMPIRDKASSAWRLLRKTRSALRSFLPLGAPIIPMYVYDCSSVRSAFHGCEVREVAFDTPMFECLRVIAYRSA